MASIATLKPKLAVAAAVVVLGLGYWHYTSLVDDLAAARAEKAAVEQQLETMTDLANRNARSRRPGRRRPSRCRRNPRVPPSWRRSEFQDLASCRVLHRHRARRR